MQTQENPAQINSYPFLADLSTAIDHHDRGNRNPDCLYHFSEAVRELVSKHRGDGYSVETVGNVICRECRSINGDIVTAAL